MRAPTVGPSQCCNSDTSIEPKTILSSPLCIMTCRTCSTCPVRPAAFVEMNGAYFGVLGRAIAPAKHEGGVVRTILGTALLTITPLLVYEQERESLPVLNSVRRAYALHGISISSPMAR
jgi:hypothetical protein